ncbi:MAG TPA: NADH-quinone oxidoreductase subunit NuoE [Actinomycetales bacterium]|nr:NADH-quinone oxidoreductase subunit NuoE [Actinomycetales bacterium]
MSAGFAPDVHARLRAEAEEIVSRYPDNPRSALGPMLHLVQSEDGFVSARGIALCAEVLGLTRAEVSAVATFYSQYRRHPNGTYNFGVCINPVCGVMGGDLIYEAVSERLGIGADETTEDGLITLERLECNAACDYAPVVMVNWEFFDNQTRASALQLVEDLLAGKDIHPTRGPERVGTFREVSRVLAGFEDGHVDEGPSAGPASLLGNRLAEEHGWRAPYDPEAAPLASETPTADAGGDEDVSEGAPAAGEPGSSADREPTTPADSDPEQVEKPDTPDPDTAVEDEAEAPSKEDEK